MLVASYGCKSCTRCCFSAALHPWGLTAAAVLPPQLDAALVMGHDHGPSAALAIVLLAVVTVGVLDGLCQGALFGDAASQPAEYTHVSGFPGKWLSWQVTLLVCALVPRGHCLEHDCCC
jgi:hypothetical protein